MANLLIVADDEALCDLLEVSFRKLGHDVEITPSGDTALSMLRAEVFEAVILDDSMSEKTPLEILKVPRAEREAGMNFTVLSGGLSPGEITEIVRAGAAGLMVKPFNLPDLLLRVEKHLEGA